MLAACAGRRTGKANMSEQDTTAAGVAAEMDQWRALPSPNPWRPRYEYAGPLDDVAGPLALEAPNYFGLRLPFFDLEFFNLRWRAKRDAKFDEAIQEPWRTKIVTIGDSWFHYPFGADLIEHLLPDCAVKTFAMAGYSLAEMEAKKEYEAAVKDIQPALFLISGGGIDILSEDQNGDEILPRLLHPAQPGQPPRVTEAYGHTLQQLMTLYGAIHDNLRGNLGYNGKIVLHGYDYPRVEEGKSYTGASLESIGFMSLDQKQAALKTVLDPFNAAMAKFAATRSDVVYVSCLNRISRDENYWRDEIHPALHGHAQLARWTYRPAIGLPPAPQAFMNLVSEPG